VRQLEGLVRDRDVRDLGAEEGQRLAGEKEPEVAVAPQRPDVEGGRTGNATQPSRFLDDGNRRRGPEALGLVGRVEWAFGIDPRRLLAVGARRWRN
jgi:hypothetical protein